MNHTSSPQIACQQILQEDNSVFSIQWIDMPPEIGSRLTQAAIHRLVTVRFLARLYRSLGGSGTVIRTIPANVRHGRRT